MLYTILQARFLKSMADELRAVIGTNHWQLIFLKELSFP